MLSLCLFGRYLWGHRLVFGFTVSAAPTDMKEQLSSATGMILNLQHLSGSTELKKCIEQRIIWIIVDKYVCMLCYVVGSRRLMLPDALQPKAYCTNPGL